MMNDMSTSAKRSLNIAVLLVTLVVVSVILGFGYESSAVIPPQLAIGQPAPETFVANRSIDNIPDPVATEQARQTAENNVAAPYRTDRSVDGEVIRTIASFYADLEEGAHGEAPVIPDTQVPDVVGLTLANATIAAQEVVGRKLLNHASLSDLSSQHRRSFTNPVQIRLGG